MKLAYEVVAIAIDQMYNKVFPVGTPDKEIEDYCQFIADAIESMGWELELFTQEYITRGIPELNEIKSNAN